MVGTRSVEGRHVVITGASSGIGAALAREYAGAGARLTLVARRRDLLEELAASCGASCFVIERDLSEVPTADWLEAAQEALGPVDVFVNNAGMQATGSTIDIDGEVGRRLLRLNLETPLAITGQLLPALVERRGTIVNVASVAALVPAPFQTWYGASKAGLAAFSEALRGELHGTGLTVVTVYPGPVATPMGDAAYAALGGRKGLLRLLPEGRPDVLARTIRRAVDRGRVRVIYPRFYVLTRWVPWLARWLTDRGATQISARVGA